MKQFSDIEVEVEKGIGRILLNHARTNSLTFEFMEQIASAIDEMERRDEVKLVILTSSLSFGFSSGLDLGDLYEEDEPATTVTNIYEAVNRVYLLSQKILNSDKLYLAALSGAVIGSALTLVLSCDLLIADKSCWFWSPDPRYRGLLADGGIELLRAKAGAARSAFLNFTNERVDAETLNSWGIIYKLCPEGELSQVASEISGRLSANSADSLKYSKMLNNRGIIIDFPGPILEEFLDPVKTMDGLRPFFNKKVNK